MTMSFSETTKQAIFTVFFSQELSLFSVQYEGKPSWSPEREICGLLSAHLINPFFRGGKSRIGHVKVVPRARSESNG